jgi:hypothetical protein
MHGDGNFGGTTLIFAKAKTVADHLLVTSDSHLRATATLSEMAETERTRRDRHLQDHCRDGQDGMAEGVGLQDPQPGR